VLNVFRMFAKMDGRRLAVESSGAISLDEIIVKGVRGQPDVSAIASLSDRKLCVLVWNYHDEDVSGPAASVDLSISNLSAKDVHLTEYRIDDEHSNSFTAWKKMGSPKAPTSEQYDELMKASELQAIRKDETVNFFKIELNLPRQSVSLLVFEW
jgi:xylan 1,4-beta-xylosidase